MGFSLVLLNGSTPGKTLRLEPARPVVTIGRHESRDLALDDHRASRLHARVGFDAGRWRLEDCGSLNGTYVNSQPVDQTVLEPGDLIRIAQRLILFADNDDQSVDLQSEMLRSTTVAGKLPSGPRSGLIVDAAMSGQALHKTVSRVVRDSAVLCRLAYQLHERMDAGALLQVAIDALVDGVGADVVTVWLIGADGRLRRAGHWGPPEQRPDTSHVLASLAVEKNKAFLIRDPNAAVVASEDRTVGDGPESLGAAMSVPIPGQDGCRGAIECRRLDGREMFSRSALDFTVVVAHQAGAALENLEHRERLEQANQELRRRLESHTRFVGSSTATKHVMDQVARIGPTNSTVLILGESGSGKELVAHSIHEVSRRSEGPYVAVNCAAFSESLLESELFGHEAGSFTGADQRRIGKFECAHRGTIFLDEVGEMSPVCQAKLLRMLEGHPFQRVGGQESIRVDVRIIAATHRDLQQMVQQGRFREDLYYRLRVIDVRLPPLRERDDDAIELATMFLEHFCQQIGRGPRRLSQSAVEAICRHSWPGNVRELKNAVERAVVLSSGEELSAADLGLAPPTENDAPWPSLASLRDVERRQIEYVLRKVEGNKTQACKILGIGRGTLYNKLEEFGVSSNGDDE